jgi:hypothetical protein
MHTVGNKQNIHTLKTYINKKNNNMTITTGALTSASFQGSKSSSSDLFSTKHRACRYRSRDREGSSSGACGLWRSDITNIEWRDSRREESTTALCVASIGEFVPRTRELRKRKKERERVRE